MPRLYLWTVLLFSVSLLTGCWPQRVSFRDGSMPEEWKTFSVATLKNEAPNAPLNYPPLLTESIKDEIQNNTRLLLSNEDAGGELYIDGTIKNYSITPVALQPGDNAAKNRLTVSVSFDIFISAPEEEKWQLTSSRFADYNSTDDFSTIENALLAEINEQITQDLINKLFSNW